MNVLLIGGPGQFMNQLITKYKKEGYRVHLLTGGYHTKREYERVFECYPFSLESEDLYEVFESVNPDITIWLGAYDTNYSWLEEENEFVKYVAHVNNLLVSYVRAARGRFYYLSSEEVFADSQTPIAEEDPATACDYKGSALIQAETICEQFRATRESDICVIRLEHLYYLPKSREDVQDVSARMCVHALEYGDMVAGRNRFFSLLYIKDAIQFLYMITAKKDRKYSLYHLSSGETISEYALATGIQKNLKSTINIVESHQKESILLDNARFDSEFGIHIYNECEQTIPDLAKYMERHRDRFVQTEDTSLPLWKKILRRIGKWMDLCLPFLENMICFIPFFMLNNRTVDSQYFARIDFYLFYVLLFAIVYGQHQAIFSAVLAISGYLFRQMYTRTGFEVALDYTTYVWMAQLFILGLAVGYMRDQIRSIKRESKEIENHLERQLRDIKDINNSNVRVKDVLENQVIDQRDSIGKVYQITSALDRYTPSEVIFYAVEMLCKLLYSKDVAIYTVSNSSFARLFSASSETARQLGNSFRYQELGEMYQELKERKVYINRSLKPEYPLMANAIYENDEIRMIVMVWGIPWERMTLSQANLLVVVSYLIQNAMLRANRYLDALREERYIKDSMILEPEAFESLVRAYVKARKKNLTQSTLLRIEDSDAYETTVISDELNTKLRQSDYLGMTKNGNIYVLLTNTNETEASIVIQRFLESGFRSHIVERLEG